MKDFFADIKTSDGVMETFISHPEQDGPFPAVVLYMDVWGVREELFDIARHIATIGYYVLVPDLYYRQGKIRLARRDENNQTISFHNLSEEDQKSVLDIQDNLTDPMVVDDTAAMIAYLDADRVVRPGPKGSIGLCMGGRHVIWVGAHHPDLFTANACLHGTHIMTDKEDSPHLLAPKLKGELYCGFAEVDQFAPLDMVKEFDDYLATCDVDYRSQIHKGAQHGYSLPDRDVFHKHAMNRDWEFIFAMFHRQIPPYAGS